MNVKIGVWGDSIVHGGVDRELGGWVNRLRLYSDGRMLSDHVFNLGLGSQNSTDVLSRIAFEVTARSNHIDHVLIGVGMNDLVCEGRQNKVAVFRDNLDKLAVAVKSCGKTLTYLTLTPCRFPDKDKWAALNEAVRDAATINRASLIDLSTSFGDEDYSDPYHPNASGHEKIFLVVKKSLLGLGIIPPE